MNRPDGRDARADAQRIAQVLAELTYPAAKWQILTEADHYGADSASRAQLWALPARVYPDLGEVLVALGLLGRERRSRVSRPERTKGAFRERAGHGAPSVVRNASIADRQRPSGDRRPVG